MPEISIIVPVYNVEPYLRKCIDSIIAQTFTDFECILIDDGSPDNCPAICDEYARKDNRIKVIHKTQNEGSSFARKTGFENSSGEYIQYIDSDDYVETDMIESLYTYALSGNYDMVCCDWYKHTESKEILYIKMPQVSNDFVQNIKCLVFGFGVIKASIVNKFIKRIVHDRMEYLKYGYMEDKYFTTQALFFSRNIGYLDKAFYHYIYNKNSWVHNPQKNWDRYNDALNNFKSIIVFLKKNHGEDISIFEPELSKRYKQIKELHPRALKRIIFKILRVIIPVKAWRVWLKKMFLASKKLFIRNT